MKKIAFSLGLLCTSAVGFLPIMSSCGPYEPYVPKIHFDASINPNNRVGFSYHTQVYIPQVDYHFNISGTIKKGDYIQPRIVSQTEDLKPCNNIEINPEYLKINISPETLAITVKIQKQTPVEDRIFSTNFALELNFMRNHETIYQVNFKNLYFVNGTPTNNEVFKKKIVGDKWILEGWESGPSIQEVIRLCDILVIPSNIDGISDNAFYDEENKISTIPPGIKALSLDASYGIPELPKQLKTIGSKSFYKAPFTNILFPETLINIGDEAFGENTNLNRINLLNYLEVPPWTQTSPDSHIFSNIPYNPTNIGQIWCSPPTTLSQWKALFLKTEGETSNIFNWKYLIVD